MKFEIRSVANFVSHCTFATAERDPLGAVSQALQQLWQPTEDRRISEAVASSEETEEGEASPAKSSRQEEEKVDAAEAEVPKSHRGAPLISSPEIGGIQESEVVVQQGRMSQHLGPHELSQQLRQPTEKEPRISEESSTIEAEEEDKASPAKEQRVETEAERSQQVDNRQGNLQNSKDQRKSV